MVEVVAGPTVGICPQMRYSAAPVNNVSSGNIAAFGHWNGLAHWREAAIAFEKDVGNVAVGRSSGVNDLPLLAHWIHPFSWAQRLTRSHESESISVVITQPPPLRWKIPGQVVLSGYYFSA